MIIPEMIERFIEVKLSCGLMIRLHAHPPPRKEPNPRGAESYDRKKALFSKNHSIISGRNPLISGKYKILVPPKWKTYIFR